jgi:ATP-binding cassette subfamily B (MDR/TAP) protein 1
MVRTILGDFLCGSYTQSMFLQFYQFLWQVAEALILGTMMVGQASAFAPNYTKAMIAAARVFNLIDRKPEIDSAAGSGLRLNRADGEIEFRGATFSYPNRTQVRVLRNLNLAIHSGKSVALGKGEKGFFWFNLLRHQNLILVA